jgi:tRNA(fMet)-specific endonuclease VapC
MLDTNIVSDLLKGQSPPARARFEQVSVDAIAVSAITEAEVLYGLERISAGRKLRSIAATFLASITCLGWNSAAARSYAVLRSRQERRGCPLSSEDTFIAANAIATGLVLVTYDQAFTHVAGLKTKDWTIA